MAGLTGVGERLVPSPPCPSCSIRTNYLHAAVFLAPWPSDQRYRLPSPSLSDCKTAFRICQDSGYNCDLGVAPGAAAIVAPKEVGGSSMHGPQETMDCRESG